MNGYGRGILGLPPVVKNIIMINVLMLLAYYAAGSVFGVDLNSLLGLYFPKSEQFKPVQIVTHMFMHAGIMHIFFNMYALFIFGPILENVWEIRTVQTGADCNTYVYACGYYAYIL